MADHWGYDLTFQVAALSVLRAVALLWFLHGPTGRSSGPGQTEAEGKAHVCGILQGLIEPELATVVIVALFLNLLHQMGGVFISLYGLGVWA